MTRYARCLAKFNLLGIDEKKICSDDFWLAMRKAACPKYAKRRQGRTRRINIDCKGETRWIQI